jgi:hypothetical protein
MTTNYAAGIAAAEAQAEVDYLRAQLADAVAEAHVHSDVDTDKPTPWPPPMAARRCRITPADSERRELRQLTVPAADSSIHGEQAS